MQVRSCQRYSLDLLLLPRQLAGHTTMNRCPSSNFYHHCLRIGRPESILCHHVSCDSTPNKGGVISVFFTHFWWRGVINQGCNPLSGLYRYAWPQRIGVLSRFGHKYGRRGGLMVSALVSGSSGPGSSPGRGNCVEFFGKAVNSHCAPLHPGV